MSFSFSITGTKQGVMRELAKVSDAYKNELRDETMAYAMSQVAQFSDDFKGLIKVEATGHHEAVHRNVNIVIQPLFTKVALDDEPIEGSK
jgi:hypothetical protein